MSNKRKICKLVIKNEYLKKSIQYLVTTKAAEGFELGSYESQSLHFFHFMKEFICCRG